MSSNASNLQKVASVEDFLYVAATEKGPLFDHPECEYLLEYAVFSPFEAGGKHQCISLRISFAAFCTATTRKSMARVKLHENFTTALYGITADSTNPHLETLLTDSSPNSNK